MDGQEKSLVSREIRRDPATGHLLKGNASLNPGGRPSGYRALLRELLGDHGRKAIETIVEIMDGTATAFRPSTRFGALPGELEEVPPTIRERLEAARILHEGANGKPMASLEISGPQGGPIAVLDYSKASDNDLTTIDGVFSRVATGPELGSGAVDGSKTGHGASSPEQLRAAGLVAD